MKDYEIFISHSTRDSELVTKLVEAIEAAGYRCWVSPRDIRAGIPYAHAIMEGLDACKVFVVVLTDNSVKSEHVLNEIDNAQNTGKHIIPLRRRDDGLELPGEFKYYLSRTQHVFTDGNNFTGIIAKMGLAAKNLDRPKPTEQDSPKTSVLPDMTFLLKKAETGDSHAMLKIALHCEQANPELALYWFEKSVEHGNYEAKSMLAYIYYSGVLGRRFDVIKRNYVKALELYLDLINACDVPQQMQSQYFGNAEYMIGCIYQDGGFGVNADKAQAKAYFQRAAMKGHERACLDLGVAYLRGQGCEIDLEEAVRWLKKASESNNQSVREHALRIIKSNLKLRILAMLK